MIQEDGGSGVFCIQQYIMKKLRGSNATVQVEELQQLIIEGRTTCDTLEGAEIDISLAMMSLYHCALSIEQYRNFSEALQNYERHDNIIALLSLLVTPVTTILKSGSTRSARLFYSGIYPNFMLAPFMNDRIKIADNNSDALKPAPHFLSNFEKFAESNDRSPLAANDTLEKLWKRAQTSEDPSDMFDIKTKMKDFLTTFPTSVQQVWTKGTHETTYTGKLSMFYKALIDILNDILPPSVQLVWEGEDKTYSCIKSDVLVSMMYKVQIDGQAKTLRQPIYCAKYKVIGSLISLGMAAVDDTLDITLQNKDSFMDDYKEYNGSSIVQWDNRRSKVSQCGNGLRNASKAMRQSVAPPFVEDCLRRAPVKLFEGTYAKLACVTAVGVGDGCSHSIAPISRNKEDFEDTWSQRRYVVLPEEEAEEYVASDAVCEAHGKSGRISNFYQLFRNSEKQEPLLKPPEKKGKRTDELESKNESRPGPSFSDYLHINDDERFEHCCIVLSQGHSS